VSLRSRSRNGSKSKGTQRVRSVDGQDRQGVLLAHANETTLWTRPKRDQQLQQQRQRQMLQRLQDRLSAATGMSALAAVSAVTGMSIVEVEAYEGKVRSRIRHVYLVRHPDVSRNINDTCKGLATQTCSGFREMAQRYHANCEGPQIALLRHPRRDKPSPAVLGQRRESKPNGPKGTGNKKPRNFLQRTKPIVSYV
jgi:hypothetical protein